MEDGGGVGGGAAGDVEADALEGGEFDAEFAGAIGECDGGGFLGHHGLLVVVEVGDGGVEGGEELGGGIFCGCCDGGLGDTHGFEGDGDFIEFLGVVEEGGVTVFLDVAEGMCRARARARAGRARAPPPPPPPPPARGRFSNLEVLVGSSSSRPSRRRGLRESLARRESIWALSRGVVRMGSM